MNRFGFKLLLILLLVAFGVFYGVDLSTRGMEQIHGPFAPLHEPDQHVDPSSDRQFTEEQIHEAEAVKAQDTAQLELASRPVGIAEMLGKALQEVAQWVVDGIVSLFEWFL